MFLAGDFNSQSDQEAYLAMEASNLTSDLHNYVNPWRRYGDMIIFTGFNRVQDPDDRGSIDFIWLDP